MLGWENRKFASFFPSVLKLNRSMHEHGLSNLSTRQSQPEHALSMH
jgi:hypothetical protein